jgi:hypothetical protein
VGGIIIILRTDIIMVEGIIIIEWGTIIVVGAIIITPSVIFTIIVRVFFFSESCISPSCERFIFLAGGIAASRCVFIFRPCAVLVRRRVALAVSLENILMVDDVFCCESIGI